MLEDAATRRAIAALSSYADDDGAEYSDDSEEPDDVTAASGLPMFQRLLFRRRSHLRRSRRRPPPACSNRAVPSQRFAVGARRRGGRASGGRPSSTRCGGRVRGRVGREPRSLIDWTSRTAAARRRPILAAPPTVPPAWTNAAALAPFSAVEGRYDTAAVAARALPRAWSRGRLHLLYKRRPRRLLFRRDGPLAACFYCAGDVAPRAEPAPLLPMAVAPPPFRAAIVAGRGRAATYEPNGRRGDHRAEMTPRAEPTPPPGAHARAAPHHDDGNNQPARTSEPARRRQPRPRDQRAGDATARRSPLPVCAGARAPGLLLRRVKVPTRNSFSCCRAFIEWPMSSNISSAYLPASSSNTASPPGCSSRYFVTS